MWTASGYDAKATYLDAHTFAIEIGQILSDVYKENLSEERLPDGKMYYNITKKILQPTLERNYHLVSDYCVSTQELLNREAGIGIAAQRPQLNQSMIDGLIDKVSSADHFDAVKWVLDAPVRNFTQHIVDESVKKNAEFQYKAGLRPKIIRTSSGHCCDWCEEVAGVYDYPKAPKDAYRRHSNCRCTVDYHPGDGKKQDVWSKKWEDEEDKIKERKEFSEKGKQKPNTIVKDAISRGLVEDEINKEKQLRHLAENHIEGRSFIHGGLKFADDLYHEFSCKGIPIVVNGVWKNKERVNTGRIVATYVNSDGIEFDSENIIIVYSRTGSHILGGRPDEP